MRHLQFRLKNVFRETELAFSLVEMLVQLELVRDVRKCGGAQGERYTLKLISTVMRGGDMGVLGVNGGDPNASQIRPWRGVIAVCVR
jgi:hypothetical protein